MQGKLLFDPVHKTLRDSQGVVLKAMDCPRLVSWGDLAVITNQKESRRLCDSCGRGVIDTDKLAVGHLVRAVRDDPEMCLRVRVGQENVEIKVFHE